MAYNLPSLVGILNITPDSFSDGGNFFAVEIAVARAQAMIAQGAQMIDVGAESTRPGAIPLTHEEEWSRLEVVLKRLVRRNIPVSVDTYHPETAQKAIDLGVQWINDVSGLQNPEMIEVVKDAPVRLIMMHNLGLPADKAVTLPLGCDVVAVVKRWARERLAVLEAAGIDRSRILFDPGIGFGKTAEQSLELIRRVAEFHDLGVPVYIGHSRKSFLRLFGAQPSAKKDVETCAVSLYLASQGVHYLRVHNVARNQKVLQVFQQRVQDAERDYLAAAA